MGWSSTPFNFLWGVLGEMSLRRLTFPKIVINLVRTYEKLKKNHISLGANEILLNRLTDTYTYTETCIQLLVFKDNLWRTTNKCLCQSVCPSVSLVCKGVANFYVF